MRKTRTDHVALIAGLLLGAFLATPSIAGTTKGTVEFGFDVGSTGFDSSVGDAGANVGLRLGYHFTEVIQLEGQLGYAGSRSESLDAALTTGLVNAVVNFSPSTNLRPYFLIGVGAANLDVEVDDKTDLAYQLSGGARFFGRQGKVGLRVELGFLGEETFDDTKEYVNFRVGLTWAFKRHTGHAAPSFGQTSRGYGGW